MGLFSVMIIVSQWLELLERVIEMKAIVIVNKNWAIGTHGKLLYSIREDMAHFKRLTFGANVIYGRKTLNSFPHGEPLKGRNNIVLSHNSLLNANGCKVVNSLEQLKQLNEFGDDNTFVIGGESVYKQLLPYCDVVYATIVYDYAQGDAHFQNLFKSDDWLPIHQSELKNDGYNIYKFVVFVRV